MKKGIFVSFVLVGTLALSACNMSSTTSSSSKGNGQEQKKVSEKEELTTYVNKTVPGYRDEEVSIMQKYTKAVSEDYKDDQQLKDTLKNDIIPPYEKFYKKVSSIQLQSPELKKAHQKYLDGINNQLTGYKSMVKLKNLTGPNAEKTKEGQEIAQHFKQTIEDFSEYKKAVKDLADKHNIKLTTPEMPSTTN
ncbi:lipoprotein [Fictibacillus macauensis ZFHKF-1]|uniref:Lipoprotein n=1 Tax=Fictibacillus macauensis ZFHKF-1 TaxID=1196324 RepID=I8UBE7_9BACL|nr:hypothetical protein [Fictibacillus macauensis]EIT84265.1 lipoprotein [Fictibacillus macauensis ZFHKF-1]